MAEDWARPVVHWEIAASDPEKLRAFYSAMFNWPIGEGPIMQIPAGIGAPEAGPAGHIRKSERSGVTLYIQVRNLSASLTQTETLGGSVIAQPRDLPNGPTIAAIADPEGNHVVLVQQ
jgi:predicted enzyme related to lactoylglutathione lyase